MIAVWRFETQRDAPVFLRPQRHGNVSVLQPYELVLDKHTHMVAVAHVQISISFLQARENGVRDGEGSRRVCWK